MTKYVNEGDETKFRCRGIPSDWWDTLSSRKSIAPRSLNMDEAWLPSKQCGLETPPQPGDRGRHGLVSNIGRTYSGYHGMKMALYLCGPPSQTCNSSLMWDGTSPSWGASYKVPGKYASKLSRCSKARQVRGPVTARRSLGRQSI